MGKRRDSEILIEIGMRLRAARDATGITRSDLAALTKVGRTSLGKWERGDCGQCGPSVIFLIRIAEALNVPVGWLLTGDTDALAGIPLEPRLVASVPPSRCEKLVVLTARDQGGEE